MLVGLFGETEKASAKKRQAEFREAEPMSLDQAVSGGFLNRQSK